MILLPGRFIYLATPRTASRSVSEVLLKQCGGKQLSDSHHALKRELPQVKEYLEPVITFIRDPYGYILAWYARVRRTSIKWRNATFQEFFDWFKPDLYNQFGLRTASYHEYVDHFYVFEHGLEAFFATVGFPHVDIPHIGRDETGARPTIEEMPPECKHMIDKCYSADLALYQSVLSKEPYTFS